MKLILEKGETSNNLIDVINCFKNLANGKYEVLVKKIRGIRTTQQNKYLFGVIYPYILQGLIDLGFDDITNVDQVHELCKYRFTKESAVNHNTSEIIDFPASTTLMNTVQFATYIQEIRKWSSEYLLIDIPDPDNTTTTK